MIRLWATYLNQWDLSALGGGLVSLFFIVSSVFMSPEASARKFSFATEDMAAYFRGTGGMSAVEQDAFEKSSGVDTLLSSEKSTFNYGAELGFLFKIHDSLNFRIGAEILQAKVSDVKGTNASGVERFTLESDIFAFNPIVNIEYVWGSGDNSRFVGYFGMGYASVRLDNKYEMTATGTSELSQSTFTEKSEGSFINGVVGVGWEGLFVDNVTAMLDVGYRFLDINKLKHSADNPTMGGGTAAKGSEVTNANGSQRTFDLGGPYIGLSFRFYIDII